MNYKNQLDAINYRIEAISEIKRTLEKATIENVKNIRKEYYLEVACFVHTLWENDDLSILFNELLSYSSRLGQRIEYAEAINKIKQSIKSIAAQILSHEHFKDLEKDYCDGWVNPFDKFPVTIKLRNLLERLNEIDNLKLRLSYDEMYTLFASDDGLNGILDRFIRNSEDNFESIYLEMESFRDNLRILFFYNQFQHDYLGVNSAIQLQTIYRAIHPLFKTSEINERIFKGLIKSGDELIEADRLLYHCKKIREYFRQKLVSKFSIDTSINRFKHYMEVFYSSDLSISSEITFQKEFELFMFNNGFFALSQGQVGNGRYDNIIINEHNAFLCEHKQIGFGKEGETKKILLSKFLKSKIQTKIYHERLKLFPELSNDIYIIIYSKFYLCFKNAISDVQMNGLTFKFRLISFEKIAPTKIRKIEEIDIEGLLK